MTSENSWEDFAELDSRPDEKHVDLTDIPWDEWLAAAFNSRPYALFVLGRVLNVVDYFRMATLFSARVPRCAVESWYANLTEICYYALEDESAEGLLKAIESYHQDWLSWRNSERCLQWLEEWNDLDDEELKELPRDAEKTLEHSQVNLDLVQQWRIRLGLEMDRGLRRVGTDSVRTVDKRLSTCRAGELSLRSGLRSWYARVRVCCRRVGFSDVLPVSSDRRLWRHGAIATIAEVESLVRQSLLKVKSSDSGEWRIGYLDLIVNSEKRAVRRKGIPVEPRILPDKPWQVFKFCWDAGHEGTKWDVCKDKYDGELDARHQVVRDLRLRLQVLKVTIDKRMLRLVDLQ